MDTVQWWQMLTFKDRAEQWPKLTSEQQAEINKWAKSASDTSAKTSAPPEDILKDLRVSGPSAQQPLSLSKDVTEPMVHHSKKPLSASFCHFAAILGILSTVGLIIASLLGAGGIYFQIGIGCAFSALFWWALGDIVEGVCRKS